MLTDEPADARAPAAAPSPAPAEGAPGRRPDRHRAPALWVVLGAIAVATVVAVVDGAGPSAVVLGLTALGAGVARVVRRGRAPEGIAVRSTWWDAVVLGGMALGILVLQGTPGV
ncbi:MAG: hypothetical protein H5T80_06325 [Dietzia sp.]|nr:hypothetical protein [Dietzia sp.]